MNGLAGSLYLFALLLLGLQRQDLHGVVDALQPIAHVHLVLLHALQHRRPAGAETRTLGEKYGRLENSISSPDPFK